MARNLERRPTHPGRLLRGEIEARELNQGQVADLVCVGRRTINEICQGRRPMSTDMAHRIGKALRQRSDALGQHAEGY